MANGTTNLSRYGWHSRIIIAACITAALMFFNLDLAKEHNILASIAATLHIIITAVLFIKATFGKWEAPERIKYRENTLEMLFLMLTASNYDSRYSHRSAYRFSAKMTFSYFGLALAWWLAIAAVELLPPMWSWIVSAVLYPLYFWYRALPIGIGRDIFVVFGTLTALAVLYSLHRIAAQPYLHKIAELEQKLKTEQTHHTNLRTEVHNHLFTVAEAVVTLKYDKRAGDKNIGGVRRNLEHMLRTILWGGIGAEELMNRAYAEHMRKEDKNEPPRGPQPQPTA